LKLADLAELLNIAEYGLRRARVFDAKERDETIYLEPLIDLVRKDAAPPIRRESDGRMEARAAGAGRGDDVPGLSVSPPIITLLTDFGTADAYVGIVKGVILSICPEARLVDLSHEVAPQDITGGALLLRSAVRYFPSGTIHVAIVDPGVGSERGAVLVETASARFVGPDNGIRTCGAKPGNARVVLLTRPIAEVPFHGRDVSRRLCHMPRNRRDALGPRLADSSRTTAGADGGGRTTGCVASPFAMLPTSALASCPPSPFNAFR
jgi:hypothetical protein